MTRARGNFRTVGQDDVVLRLSLTPADIVDNGSTVSAWGPLTASGSPAVSNALACKGVVFDGVNDRLDGRVEVDPDTTVTIFVASKQVYGGVAMVCQADFGFVQILETSSYRTPVYGVANQDGALYVFTAETHVVHRFKVRLSDRAIYENGLPKGAADRRQTSHAGTTSMRIGAFLAGTNWWAGTITHVVVYQGEMSTTQAESVQASIMAECGITAYATWPAAATDANGGDPEFNLDPITYGIVGHPIRIQKDSVQRRTPISSTSQVVVSDLTPDPTIADAWVMRANYAGDYAFRVTENGFTATTTIRVVDALAANAANRYALFFGDSNVVRMGYGALEYLGRELGSRLVLLGTQQVAGYSYLHEGHDSYSYATYDNSGAPGASPFYNGGVIDIAHYEGLIAHTPDFVFASALANDIYGSTDGTVDANVTTAFAHLETVRVAMMSRWSTLRRFVVFSPTTSACSDVNVHGNAEASRLELHRTNVRGSNRVRTSYNARSAEKIDSMTIQTRFDNWRGHTDLLHLNPSPGNTQMFEPLLAWLVANWNAS